MATSGSITYTATHNKVIERALRICGVLGTNETYTAPTVDSHLEALNMILKEWEAEGVTLWKIKDISITLTVDLGVYRIFTGATSPNCAAQPVLKVMSAYLRDSTDSTNPIDTPLLVYTKSQWDEVPNKSLSGRPTQYYYEPPRAVGVTGAVNGTNPVGTLYIWPRPDIVTNLTVVITGAGPIEDATTTTQVDIPQYMFNALSWALADQLAYEYGLPLAERSQINKKAMYHKALAMSFDQEEGSLYLFPEHRFGDDNG